MLSGISQFYLHAPRSFVDGMDHTCLCLPAEAATHLMIPKLQKAEFAWVIRTVSKQLAQDCHAMFNAAANQSKTFILHWAYRCEWLAQSRWDMNELTTSELQA